MAESAVDVKKLDEGCKEYFMFCAEKCAGKELPLAEKKVGKSNVCKKALMEGAGIDKPTMNTVDASIFPKHSDKAKKITADQFVCNVLPDLATEKCKGKKEKKADAELLDMKKKIYQKNEDRKKETKKGDSGVVKRLTDTKGYTGAHKSRFDEEGKGKGIEGREDRHDGSGYVNNYGGQGTYDRTHKC